MWGGRGPQGSRWCSVTPEEGSGVTVVNRLECAEAVSARSSKTKPPGQSEMQLYGMEGGQRGGQCTAMCVKGC